MNANRIMQAITESYCEANGIPIRAKTTEAERELALNGLVAVADSAGFAAGQRLLAPSLCPYPDGALADAWQAGRMRGLAEAFARAR